MRTASISSKAIGVVLIVAIQMVYTPAVADSSTAGLSGEILSADAGAPMPGVVVRVLDPGTGDLYTSPPTDDKGVFAIEALPPATYSVSVQQGSGLFKVSNPIVLAPGESRSIQLALYKGNNDDDDEAAPSPGEAAKNPTYKSSGWENPLTATLIAIGIAVVVGYAVDKIDGSDKKKVPSSPVMP